VISAQASADVLDELVHQFTDSFAFYRELIQNSIDAGSTRIEVQLAYRPSAKGGVLTASVTDWGEGMNRRIIEDYLVTKFRSLKENDLTKIGKFGIGFVSVFACRPDVLTVDTGRDGESWRVLFKKDRSYELLALSEPVEGTTVTVHKSATASEYAAFAAHSEAAVKKWCRHSDSEVMLAIGPSDGRPVPPPKLVREPLRVDAPFQVEHREEGTVIVAGPARRLPAPTSLYNRGLTLLETIEPMVPGVALEIVSREFEHTLTRDNVKRDDGFNRVMALARKLADGPLLDALPRELEKAARDPANDDDYHALFEYARTRLSPGQLTLRAPGGGAVAGEALLAQAKRDRALVVAAERSPVVERLLAAGVPVLEQSAHQGYLERVGALAGTRAIHLADKAFTWAEQVPEGHHPLFCAALATALRLTGATTSEVVVAPLHGGCQEEPFMVAAAIGRPMRVEHARRSPFVAGAGPLLCLNLAHPEVAKAVPLLRLAPKLAALLIARLVLVVSGKLSVKADTTLTTWALE